MKRLLYLFLALSFFISFSSSALAQELTKFPIKDSAITIVGSGEGTPAPTDPGPGPAPDCGQIDQRLKDDFGAEMKEGGGVFGGNGNTYPAETPDCETKRGFYRALSMPQRSPRFMELLRPREIFTIRCFMDTSEGGSSGFVPSRNLMQWRNCYKIKGDFKPYAFLVVHETGHIMKHRNYRELQQGFPRTQLIRENPNCFNNEGVIKTYNRRGVSCSPTYCSKTSESSAEAIALYVHNSKDGQYANINNFKRECPSVYEWAKRNVYGGTEFN